MIQGHDLKNNEAVIGAGWTSSLIGGGAKRLLNYHILQIIFVLSSVLVILYHSYIYF